MGSQYTVERLSAENGDFLRKAEGMSYRYGKLGNIASSIARYIGVLLNLPCDKEKRGLYLASWKIGECVYIFYSVTSKKSPGFPIHIWRVNPDNSISKCNSDRMEIKEVFQTGGGIERIMYGKGELPWRLIESLKNPIKPPRNSLKLLGIFKQG